MRAAVDHFVRIVHQLDFITACFQYIAASTAAVKGSHVLLTEGNRQRLGFTGVQQAGFGKPGQDHVRFLHAALRIRCGVIHLCHVLSGYAASVFHLHLHNDIPAAIHKTFNGLAERGIAETIAERILYGLVIVDEAIRRGRLIIAVAHINAFSIFHIVALEIAVGKAARIGIGRRGSQIVCVNIGQAAGRIHTACQHSAHSIKAHSTGAAHPQAGIHALHEAQFHGVGGIDEHNHLCIILCFHQVQQVFLILGQLQIMTSIICLAVTCCEHIHGQVTALAADS